MLQQANRQIGQAGLLSTEEPASKITPSLAALDDAQALRMRTSKITPSLAALDDAQAS